jgi:hypothetical protein
MDVLLIGTAMIGSIGAAFVMQKALLGAMLYAIDPNRKPR